MFNPLPTLQNFFLEKDKNEQKMKWNAIKKFYFQKICNSVKFRTVSQN